MNRNKIITAIRESFKASPYYVQEAIVVDALKWMSDGNLIAFANEIGVNTDELFRAEAI